MVDNISWVGSRDPNSSSFTVDMGSAGVSEAFADGGRRVHSLDIRVVDEDGVSGEVVWRVVADGVVADARYIEGNSGDDVWSVVDRAVRCFADE